MVTLPHNPSLRGFGLIELMVSISIVSLVTGIVIARHNAFNSAILLRNQAYEIAFAIRQAQQLAVSGVTDPLSAEQLQRYGVHISSQAGTLPFNNQTLIIYKDNKVGGLYNGVYNTGDQIIQAVRLDKRFQITGVYENSSPLTERQILSVLFERPLFDGNFKYGSGSGSNGTGPVRIVLQAIDNPSAQREIFVTTSGQVTVK